MRSRELLLEKTPDQNPTTKLDFRSNLSVKEAQKILQTDIYALTAVLEAAM